MKKILLIIFVTLIVNHAIIAQDKIETDSTKGKKEISGAENFNPSLEDLMNVPIISASREKENIFDAPLSAYVISRQEIEKFGATSIPDALKMIPGVLVTEMANGTYQVDIRGLNNTPAFTNALINKTILVMIDNRPVFNQFQGGTYWENLPVEINDVERIEVVQGPSAALFGPNAASGVINIITRRLEKKGLMLYSNSQRDYKTNSAIANLSIGYKVNDKLSFIVSGNISDRKRQIIDYYSTDSSGIGSFSGYDSVQVYSTYPKQDFYPQPGRAVNKKAFNFYATYTPAHKIKFDISAGYQNADPLRMTAIDNVGTAMFYAPSHSFYFMGKAEIHNFSFQFSNIRGVQTTVKGVPSFKYDFHTSDFYIDYTYRFKKLFTLKPALSYQDSFISDLPYIDKALSNGVFNGKATMYNYSGSLKFEINPLNFLRFVAAGRADRFRYPENKTFFSYELIVNIKPNENHQIRLISSRAYQGSYMFPVLLNFSNEIAGLGSTAFAPNLDLNPAHIDLLEVGYRVKLFSNLNIDVSFFNQQGSGYSKIVYNAGFGPSGLILNFQHRNIPLKAIQNGFTLAVNSSFLNNKLQVKPFITVSQTQLKDFSPFSNSPSSQDGGLNSQSYHDITSNYTPGAFGGFFINATPTGKWNINLSMYSYGKYSLYTYREVPAGATASNPSPVFSPYTTTPATDIKNNLMWNGKVAYKVHQNFKLYVSARNATNTLKRQFYAGDQIGAMYLAGFTIDF